MMNMSEMTSSFRDVMTDVSSLAQTVYLQAHLSGNKVSPGIFTFHHRQIAFIIIFSLESSKKIAYAIIDAEGHFFGDYVSLSTSSYDEITFLTAVLICSVYHFPHL
jgi:hypothetical protein